MTYYTLSNSIKTEEIGKEYPQIQDIGGTMHVNAPDSISKVFNELPNFTPNLNYLEVHKKSTLTDIVSASVISKGFLVNQRVKDILVTFSLPKHQFHPATLRYKKEKYSNYYWFLYDSDLSDLIDYEKTDFLIADSFGEREDVTINSKEELTKLYHSISTLRDIRSTKIIYKEPIKFDLFHAHLADIRTLISNNLKAAFESEKITGAQIAPVKFI